MIKQLKAKTRHECHVCNKDILPGCDYIQEKTREGGLYFTLNRHIHCDAVLYAMDSVFLSRTTEHIINNICATYCDKDCLCNKENLYSCFLVHKMLLSPVVFNAARKSVIENGGVHGE